MCEKKCEKNVHDCLQDFFLIGLSHSKCLKILIIIYSLKILILIMNMITPAYDYENSTDDGLFHGSIIAINIKNIKIRQTKNMKKRYTTYSSMTSIDDGIGACRKMEKEKIPKTCGIWKIIPKNSTKK